MSIDKAVRGIRVKTGPINFKSYSFLKRIAEVKKRNKTIDKISKIDYQKMDTRIDYVSSDLRKLY